VVVACDGSAGGGPVGARAGGRRAVDRKRCEGGCGGSISRSSAARSTVTSPTWSTCTRDFFDYLRRGPARAGHAPSAPGVVSSRNLVAAPPGHLAAVRLAPQLGACPPGVPLLEEIENGVDTDALPMRCAKRRYAFTMGRICPEKNFHVAFEAAASGLARAAGRRIIPYVGPPGVLPPANRAATRAFVPVLGPVGFARKRRLLSGAVVCSCPASPRNQLPGGDEALACGTPVVAFGSGPCPTSSSTGAPDSS